MFKPTASLLAALALACSIEAQAQEDSAGTTRRDVYEPAFFERFAPRNALDMLEEVPGFEIRGGDGGRGLGQSSENVLVNGERLTSKSEGARAQLARIPADTVVRIEIVDGTTLDIPGLTGQVANVVTGGGGGLSGQFRYEGGFRFYNTDPELYGGEVSISGELGRLGYTLALSNENNRFGNDGPTVLTDAAGRVIERQFARLSGGFDDPSLNARLVWELGGGTEANLNANYEYSRFRRRTGEVQFPIGGLRLDRDDLVTSEGPEYEVSGDVRIPLLGGTMKLIGLESYDTEDVVNTLIDLPADGSPARGSRFTREGGEGERIGRAEFNFAALGVDWQLSGEGAFNRLDRVSGLFRLAPDGAFVSIPFPAGTGGVREARYQGALAGSTRLSSTLALQANLGGEFSRIEQTGGIENARSFRRPKGSASLAWRPGSGFDAALEIRRSVGQLDFGDFLARVFLDDDNANQGNADLVPEQSWDYVVELNKTLGPWGSTKLRLERRRIEDFIDFVPLATGGEGRGNIDRATVSVARSTSTLRLDPIGLTGGQIDLEISYAPTRLIDPLTGLSRAFSNANDLFARFDYRHDVLGSSWAYGANLFYQSGQASFRLAEISTEQEGPVFADLFLENKDVFGLTVRAVAANLLGGRDTGTRTVFDTSRADGAIRFVEAADRRIGPIFRFSVSGSF